MSERNDQLERGGTWDTRKGFVFLGLTGIWLVTPDEVPDPHALGTWMEVDRYLYQNGSTCTMIFGVAQLVACLRRFGTPDLCDMIYTDTPRALDGQQAGAGVSAPQTTKRLSLEGSGECHRRIVAA